MTHFRLLVALLASSSLAACAGITRQPQLPLRPVTDSGAYAVDAGGRPIASLETGSTLWVGGQRLRPNTLYEFRFALGRQAIAYRAQAAGFARIMTDQVGRIPPFVLWYQSGVVGCSPRVRSNAPFTFRSFEEAERRLRGRVLTVSAHPVERDPTGRRPPLELRAGSAETVFDLPVAARRSPTIFASDARACLLNSQFVGDDDLYVSGRNFTPGEVVEVAIVPNQRAWRVGDWIADVTGANLAAAPERVQVDSAGRFTVLVWDRVNQQRGAYDIVARRLGQDTTAAGRISPRDIASYAAETGVILALRYPVGGPTMDIAGRPLSGSPYFEFADAFAETGDPVWAAVDPTYVPTAHPGGSWAAYYVVTHRDVAGWTPAMGGSTILTDVSGGIEIHPVKAGCINGTDVIVWNSPLTLGQFDVVVEFGSTAATSAATYVTDGSYDEPVDFLDGADQIGFRVARDPHALGNFAVGESEYSTDDFFPVLGNETNVDLRAVVRYPATTAGQNQPVATGAHPLFLIEHGNHSVCRSATTGDVHQSCPLADRVPNHKGYMRLLEILASHGVIAVSIDAYDLTGISAQRIWERGTLILKHIELWSHMNNTATFTSYPDFFAGRFAGRVDLTGISVSGHSRGGEASVAAYMLNAASASPFSIGSVSSIAPVDGQAYVLPDVPYFVVLPAADCDVSSLSGARIYDRAGSSLPTPDATTKSGIYVYGANHNFFNTVWAADWDDCGVSSRPDYINAADQQRLGEAYLAAFARVHLLNETAYDDMLRGRLTFPSTAGYKIYALRHERTHSRLVSGSPAAFAPGTGSTVVGVTNPSPHSTQVVRIAWSVGNAEVTHTVLAGQRDASSFEVLAFRVAQTWSTTNPATGSQDFVVELIGGGKTKAVFVGKFDVIPKPYPNPDGYTHTVMTAVRIPLHSFIMNNAGVTLNNIDTIRFRFSGPSMGEVYVDDVEFSR